MIVVIVAVLYVGLIMMEQSKEKNRNKHHLKRKK